MSTLQHSLRDWAGRQAPSEERLDELRCRIRMRAVEERAHDWGGTPSGILGRLSYAAVGAAAALAVASLIYWQQAGPDRAEFGGDGGMRMALISPEAMRGGQELYGEVERLFDDRLRWVAQSNGDVSLGVDTLVGGVTEACLPAVVKLVVVARGSGQTDWRPVWQTEVILRSEEAVEVAPKQDAVDRLALWVYPLTDGRIAVDTELALAAPLKLASQHNAVMAPGVPVELVDIQQNGMEYRLLQTVAMLDGSVGR